MPSLRPGDNLRQRLLRSARYVDLRTQEHEAGFHVAGGPHHRIRGSASHMCATALVAKGRQNGMPLPYQWRADQPRDAEREARLNGLR